MEDEAPFDKAWRKLLDGAVNAALKAAEREEGAAALDKLTGLFGTTTEALKADPTIARGLVERALRDAATVAQDAASGDPTRRAHAREAVERLGERVGLQPAEGGRPPWLDTLEATMKELPQRAASALQELAHPGDAAASTAEPAADAAATAPADDAASAEIIPDDAT